MKDTANFGWNIQYTVAHYVIQSTLFLMNLRGIIYLFDLKAYALLEQFMLEVSPWKIELPLPCLSIHCYNQTNTIVFIMEVPLYYDAVTAIY